jgi:hypothetical protein
MKNLNYKFHFFVELVHKKKDLLQTKREYTLFLKYIWTIFIIINSQDDLT